MNPAWFTTSVNAATLNVSLNNHSNISPARDPIAAAREIKAAADGASCTTIAFTCRKNAVEIALLEGLMQRLLEQNTAQIFTVSVS